MSHNTSSQYEKTRLARAFEDQVLSVGNFKKMGEKTSEEAIGKITTLEFEFNGRYRNLVQTLRGIDEGYREKLGGPLNRRGRETYTIFQSHLDDHGKETTSIRIFLGR